MMSALKTTSDLDTVLDSKPEDIASDSDDEEAMQKRKYERYDKEKGHLDSEGLWYQEHAPVEEGSGSSAEEDEGEDLGLEAEESDGDQELKEVVEEPSANPLIESLSKETVEEKRAKKAELWFQKIGDLDSDSDLEDAEIKKCITSVEKKGATMRQKKDEPGTAAESGYTSGSDEDDRQE